MAGVSIALPGRVVVFDYGEVISLAQSAADRGAMVAAAGVAEADFWPAYQAERGRLDEGVLSTGDYWAGIARACGTTWDLPTVQRLWALDIRSWTSADPDVVQVLADLAAGGTRIALLSNAAAEYGGLFRFSPAGALLERVFVSGELLLVKPDPAIYRYVAAALAVEPSALVFVDDKEANVRGAESVGVAGHVHTDAAALRRFLESLT